MDLKLRPTPRGPRCVYCREESGAASFSACEACGAVLHRACRSELGRCPTIGCRAPPRQWVALPDETGRVRQANCPQCRSPLNAAGVCEKCVAMLPISIAVMLIILFGLLIAILS